MEFSIFLYFLHRYFGLLKSENSILSREVSLIHLIHFSFLIEVRFVYLCTVQYQIPGSIVNEDNECKLKYLLLVFFLRPNT